MVPAPTLDNTTACDINSDACWVTALSEEKSKTGHSTEVVEDIGEKTSLHKDIHRWKRATQHNSQGSETNLPADISGRSINFKYGGKIILQIFSWEENCSLPVGTKSRLVSF